MILPMMIKWGSFIFFSLAGVVHVGFFLIESILLQKKVGQKILGISDSQHAAVKVWALNQGFYNLFLALGTFVGLSFVVKKRVLEAGILTGFCGLSMIAAGLVLGFTSPHLRKWALLQALPPLAGLLFLYFHITGIIN